MLLLAAGVLAAGCGPKVRINVKVVDDDNQPVRGAKVIVMGLRSRIQGKTGKDGIFTAKFRNLNGHLDMVVERKGFYSINWFNYNMVSQTNDQWMPWDANVELLLRKQHKPIVMMEKQVQCNVPVIGKPVGYDLLAGDWVKPYGRGVTNDFIFLAERWLIESNQFESRLKLSAPNPDDGLVQIRVPHGDDYDMHLPGIPPELGYANHWEWRLSPEMEADPTNACASLNGDRDSNFYFRVRSTHSLEGKLASAMYGKIYWGVEFRFWEQTQEFALRFLYYLNPDGTRNTEFDPRSGLSANSGTGGGKP